MRVAMVLLAYSTFISIAFSCEGEAGRAGMNRQHATHGNTHEHTNA